jgi:hypothetical protein
MKSCLSCVICFQVLLFSAASAADYGRFVGTVKTEWGGDGRHMTLLEPFRYIDPAQHEWLAPAGSIVDGASIPQFAWSIIGGPFEGKYRDASVIHDVACQQKIRPWADVHLAFYYAMLANRVESWKAKTMYAAVYHFGPRWKSSNETIVEPRRLRQEDFNQLKNEIKRREEQGRSMTTPSPAMTLNEIEQWRNR